MQEKKREKEDECMKLFILNHQTICPSTSVLPALNGSGSPGCQVKVFVAVTILFHSGCQELNLETSTWQACMYSTTDLFITITHNG